MGVYCIRVSWPLSGARFFPLDPPYDGLPPYRDVKDHYQRTKLDE